MEEPPHKKLRMDVHDSSNRDHSEDMFEAAAEEDADWAGVLLSSLPRLGPGSELRPQWAAPRPSPRHTVGVALPVSLDSEAVVAPHPPQLRDVWDGRHVRLPWSQDNLYPVPEAGRKVLRSRWQLIVQAVTASPIKSCHDLQEVILSYNVRYRGHADWSFSSLHKLFSDEFTEEESDNFFQCTLPKMVELLVRSPNILTCPLPLLTAGTSHSITLSQQQVAIILINAFFCTFPRRNATKAGAEFSNYPYINFNTLYGECPRRPAAHLEKLKCLMCYFSRIVNFTPTGLITFSRRCLLPEQVPAWRDSGKRVTNLHVTSRGTIEAEGAGMLQVDFANKFVGGGVLTSGLVQEEIRFTVCPELIASTLFTEVLHDNEVAVVVGAEQFSNYEGYSDTFTFTGRHHDTTGLDSSGRRETSVVAMDAARVTRHEAQFQQSSLDRELNKAFLGFSSELAAPGQLQAVATGNWGCGAFGGDVKLKFIIQLLAASETGRDMAYFTFGDQDLVREAGAMFNFLVDNKVSVGDLYRTLCTFCTSSSILNGSELFKFIYKEFNKNNAKAEEAMKAYSADTDEENVSEQLVNGKITESGGLRNNNAATIHSNSNEDPLDAGSTVAEESKVAEAPRLKNGGFFAALDKMERGELSSERNNCDNSANSVHSNGGNRKEEHSTQSKVTDFFQKK